MRESSLAQEFMLEGEQIGRRKSVLDVLQARFGEDAARECEEAINGIGDLARLQELVALAAQARRITQFRRALAGE